MNEIVSETSHIVNVIVLAAGRWGCSEQAREYPLCLEEFDGLSVLGHIVKSTNNFISAQYTFAFLEDEDKRYHLQNIASLLVPGAKCVQVTQLSQGSACTALLVACQLKQDAELIIISTNEVLDLNLAVVVNEFRSRSLDGGLLSFHSSHPRYSYVRLDDNGLVMEVAQRNPISFNATAGFFWYSSTSLFVESAKSMIRKDAHIEGSYFLAPTFNELVLRQKKIGIKEIDLSNYKPLKSEQQLNNYIEGSQS
jgi:hypothetical protein